MFKKFKKWYILLVILTIGIVFIPFTYSKYITTINKKISINAKQPEYDVVFLHKLPKEYQLVEYIKSTGTQYINTGIPASDRLSVEIEYVDTSATGSNYVLGSRDGDYGSIIYYGLVGSSNDNSISAYYNTASNNQQKFSTTRVLDEEYYALLEIEHDETLGYRMHSYLEDFTAGTSEDKYSPYFIDGLDDNLPNIYVFAIKPGNVHRGMILYSLRMYENGELVANFIPCYRKSDNAIGLFNMVTSTFHGNSGSGTFIKGDNIDEEDSYYEAGTQHFVYGTPETLNPNTFNKTGYTFSEWNTEPDGTGDSYEDEEEVDKLTTSHEGQVFLYSQWEPITYNVDFYPNYPGSINGYTPIEYIRSDGHQYINSGFTPNQDTRVVMDFEYISGYRFFGSERRSNSSSSAASTNAFRFGKSSQNKWYISYGTQGTRSVGSVSANRYLVDFNKNIFSVNGEALYTYNYETFNAYGQAYIFNINHNYFSVTDSPSVIKLYSLKIYDDETLVRDYIPVIRDSDGVIGLYDKVNDTFYPSIGSASLIEGIYSQTLTYDENDELIPNAYSFVGYKFIGWNTSPDGTGTSYDDEETVLNLSSTENDVVNLYAQWEIQYLLTVNAGNGIQYLTKNGWYNSGTNSISKYVSQNELVDLNEITVTNYTDYSGAVYNLVGNNGNIANNILSAGTGNMLVTADALELAAPTNVTASGGTRIVYGYQNNNLTCSTDKVYQNNVTFNYSFGYSEDVYAVNSINNANLYDEITIGTERFYVIEKDGNNITLLTKYGLNTSSIIQSESSSSSAIFTGSPYWNDGVGTTYPGSYSGSPKPYIYDSNSLLYNHINNYADKIGQLIGTTVTGKLMSYEQAVALSQQSFLALASGSYWLGSTGSSSSPYVVNTSGGIASNFVQSSSKVRPILIFNNLVVSAENAEPTNWSQYSTSNTYSVPMDYKGERIYSCKINAYDGFIYSEDSIAEHANSTNSTYLNARINLNSSGGIFTSVNKFYVEYESSNIYENVFDTSPLLTMPKSYKQDYDFNGWWTEATGGVQVITSSGVILPNVTGYTNSLGEWILTNPTDSIMVNNLYAQYTESTKYLYDILRKENTYGSLSRLFSGNHQDSMDSTKSTEDVYYWYGLNTTDSQEILNKNNIVFADFCWQLIRTTDTGGIKMIYNGIPIKINQKDGIQYDCGTTRPGQLSSIQTTQSLSGTYVYGKKYTTSVSGSTTTYTLSDTVTKTISSSNGSTEIPDIVNNYSYTCKSSSNSCTTLYKVLSYTTGANVRAVSSTYRDTIGTSTFNASNSSISYVGYMYNSTYSSSSYAFSVKKENVITKTTLSSTNYTTYQGYSYGDGYNLSGNNHVLTNAATGSQIAGYPDTWENLYHCASASSSCSTMYYIISVDNSGTYPVLYRASYGSGVRDTDSSNKYLFGDTLVDNGDGTFSLSGNVKEIDRKDWLTKYSTVTSGGFVCFPNKYTYNSSTGENVCSDTSASVKAYAIGYITAITEVDFSFYPVYKYGYDIEADSSSIYRLTGNSNSDANSLQYIYNWTNTGTSNCFTGSSNLSSCGYKSLSNSHYTCFNLSGKCSTYFFVTNATTTNIHNVSLSGGKKINTNISDTNNALYTALYASNVNNTNSTIKTNIESWYLNNLLNDYDDYIDDVIYCGDRSINLFGGWNPSGSNTGNPIKFRASSNTRDLTCVYDTDKFSISNPSARLTYKVGLLTSNEVNLVNIISARAAAYNYWLMTPFGMNDYRAINYYISNTGTLSGANPVSQSYSIRPVISLVRDLQYSKGDGSTNNPYVVDLNSLNNS